MYPHRPTASNTLALIVGMLLMCAATQSRAVPPEDAGSDKRPAEAAAILFSSEGKLWVVNSDGSGLKEVRNARMDGIYSISWSPDGSRIAYLNYRRFEGHPLGMLNVWVMNANGSGVTPLTGDPVTGDPKRVFVQEPAWSHDGRKLAAISQLIDVDEDNHLKPLSSDIFVVNTDGSGAKPLLQLTNPAIGFENLIWSPDGRKIAFLSNRRIDGNDDEKPKELNRNIWVMNSDGSHVMPLTRFNGTSVWIWGDIGWSPDSRKVTYISNRAFDGSDAPGAGFNIWVSNADGSGSLPLTRFRKTLCNAFTWSPDGSRLSFSSNDSLDSSDSANSNINIWVMKADGSAPVPLTTERVFELSNDRPQWSPDGSLIAFVSCINGSSAKPRPVPDCKLSIMKADGTGARQLSEKNVGWMRWRQ